MVAWGDSGGSFPAPRTPLIGRERELGTVRALALEAPGRLLTLTGAGGCGKTRLAIAVATELRGAFPGGVWWVELAAQRDATPLPALLAAAAGVPLAPGSVAAEALIEAWCGRAALLVLDNCEHLIDAVASLVDRLLSGCPALRILGTSREPLQVAGERQWRVPPLATPDPDRLPPMEELARCPAVQLFVERAQAVEPAFRLTTRNAVAVARVCARLDGLPLALELAAARMGVLTAEEFQGRLDDRFRLLTAGSRTAPTRQQTLRATLDWSHDLLAENERVLFHRLAVFTGGWLLAAAEAVCTGGAIAPGAVLDLLARLVDCSLVVAEATGVGERYRLLETVREYALERLRASEELATVRARHAAHFLTLATEAPSLLPGPGRWLRRLGPHDGNLRLALAWFAEHREVERGLRLGEVLWLLHLRHGQITVGLAESGALLQLARADGPAPHLARLLEWVALFTYMQGDYAAARSLGEESLATWRALGDRAGIASILSHLGVYAREQGDADAALAWEEEGLAAARALGDARALADALIRLGEVAQVQGNPALATSCYTESGTLLVALGERSVRLPHHLGSLALDEGRYPAARDLFRESLALQWQLGEREWTHSSLADLASVAAAEGDAERAIRLTGAAATAAAATGAALQPTERARLEHWIEPARRVLGKAATAAAWAAGRALTPERAMADALGRAAPALRPATPGRPAPPVSPLTPREREVAALLAGGVHSDRAIAVALTISEATAGTHVQRLLAKLGLHSRWEVAAWANAHARPA
jgi:predicted ATPase/DNA-binding CsgD family transcriptional regulator